MTGMYSLQMLSLFHSLQSLSFQKLAIEARLGGRSTSMVPPGQSFLSQQRQVTNATRRTLSVSVPATTAN
jgi:hypothetical protein